MSDFVEECRREWRRLRVPEAAANEMAADLAADLREAEAEGVSPEEVLGDAVFDPRAFAASWATERGLVQPSRPSRRRRRARPVAIGVAVALAAFLAALFAIAKVAPRPHTATTGSLLARAPASGAARVALPDVVGLDEVAAIPRLRSLGLGVRIVSRGGHGPRTVVRGESPAPGSVVPGGTTVTLVVAASG